MGCYFSEIKVSFEFCYLLMEMLGMWNTLSVGRFSSDVMTMMVGRIMLSFFVSS